MEESKKKSNKGLIVLVVVLIILLLGSIGYICYDKGAFDRFIGKEEAKQEEQVKKENSQSIDVSDSELNMLLESIPTAIYPIGANSDYIDAYVGKFVTISDISSYVLLNYALNDLKESDFSKDAQNSNSYLSFTKINEKVNKVYKNFDNNMEIDVSNIKTLDSGSVVLSKEFKFSDEDFGDLLYYDSNQTKGLTLGTFQKTKGEVYKNLIKKYNDSEGNLIVEQKVGALSRPIDIGMKYELYTATNDSNSIYSSSSEKECKDYFEQNQDKFKTYKQTFKKASDGKYYWYSSEIVNE